MAKPNGDRNHLKDLARVCVYERIVDAYLTAQHYNCIPVWTSVQWPTETCPLITAALQFEHYCFHLKRDCSFWPCCMSHLICCARRQMCSCSFEWFLKSTAWVFKYSEGYVYMYSTCVHAYVHDGILKSVGV